MLGKLSGWDDTIVALATPQGIGAIGVIRISGNHAIDVINTMFPSKNLGEQSSHTLHVGVLKDGDELLDEVVISLFKAPKSYTGENVIEISCHGSPFIQEKIIQLCKQLELPLNYWTVSLLLLIHSKSTDKFTIFFIKLDLTIKN